MDSMDPLLVLAILAHSVQNLFPALIFVVKEAIAYLESADVWVELQGWMKQIVNAVMDIM